MDNNIRIENLRKSFKEHEVLRDLTLDLTEGTVYGLVGLNGAGKTTLLRLLLGLLKPDSGTISLGGTKPWSHAAPLYRSCGVVLENDGFWGNLTTYDNCSLYAAAKGVSKSDLDHYLATWWNESPLFAGSKRVKTLSRGQRMQCALCRAFMGEPRFFFLDEPVIALDLNGYSHFHEMVTAAKERGAILIISSHQLDTIDALCNRVGILENGRITDITRQGTDDREPWFIATIQNSATEKILEKYSAEKIEYEKGYTFLLTDAVNSIPAIIKELILADTTICEVRRQDDGYSAMIQSYYTNSRGATGS